MAKCNQLTPLPFQRVNVEICAFSAFWAWVCCKIWGPDQGVRIGISQVRLSPYIIDFQTLKRLQKKIYFTHIYSFVCHLQIT